MPKHVNYVGLIDDYGIRHHLSPYGRDPDLAPECLEAEFLRSLYFDEEILLNDGYLSNSYGAQVMVLHPDDWPLKWFARKGLAHILTRTGGQLGTLIDRMAEEKIVTFTELQNHAALKGALQNLGDDLREQGRGFRPWPPYDTVDAFFRTTSAGYNQAIGHAVYSVPDSKFETVFTAYKAGAKKRRNEWELVVQSAFRNQLLDAAEQRELLRFGNEAYHYNWGALLTAASYASSGPSFRVLTTATEAFQFLRERPTDEGDSSFDASKIEPITLLMPSPSRRRRSWERKTGSRADAWDSLTDIFHANEIVRRARTDFLTACDAYYLKPAETTKKGAQSAATAYSLAVGMAYTRQSVDRCFQMSVALLGASTSFLPGGAAVGFLLNLVVSAAAVVASSVASRSTMLTSLRRRILPFSMNSVGSKPPDASHLLALDPAAVTGHLMGVKTFQ